MDSIFLRDITVRTHIGVPETERKTEQQVFISVELFTLTKEAAAKDDISGAIDYAQVTGDVVALAATERKTIERFAEDIAALILKKYKPWSVKVTVAKTPELPLQSVSITIQRP